MLDSAFKYEEEINKMLINTWYDDKYKYYHASSYRTCFELPRQNDGDWNGRHFVSIDKNGNIIGLINYEINRESNIAQGFGAINFTDNKVVFAMDLAQVIDDIFCKFNHQKMEWTVIQGNPIEENYDKLCEKYGGSIVGIYHKHYKLIDNQYYNSKMYELFREDYIKAKEKTYECN